MKTRLLIVVLVSALLAGCGGFKKIKNPKHSNSSLVYGHFDISDAPGPLNYVKLHQVKPMNSKVKDTYITEEAHFFNNNVRPGSYVLSEFGTIKSSFFTGTTIYRHSLNDYGEDVVGFRVPEKPGLIFLGSFKYIKGEKGGLFKAATFGIKRSNKPTEKEVLQDLLPLAKGTKWEAMIKERIKRLK